MIGAGNRTGPNRESGLALVVVLWILVVLSMAATAFATAMRIETTIALNETTNARARALADAGVHRGILALFVFDQEQKWAVDGSIYELTFGGGEIAISIQRETGKIDLNVASEELIKGLLQSTELDGGDAEAIGDAILDWRDEDDLRQARGAETPDYVAGNLPYGAKNDRFDSIDELQQVLGMTYRIYQRLAPAITVYSGAEGIDPAVAPRAVLLALPDVDVSEVEALLEIRRQNRYSIRPEPLPSLSGVAQWLSAGDGTAFTVRGEARLPDGATFTREAVVWLPPDGDRAYWILDWRTGAAGPGDDELSQ